MFCKEENRQLIIGGSRRLLKEGVPKDAGGARDTTARFPFFFSFFPLSFFKDEVCGV